MTDPTRQTTTSLRTGRSAAPSGPTPHPGTPDPTAAPTPGGTATALRPARPGNDGPAAGPGMPGDGMATSSHPTASPAGGVAGAASSAAGGDAATSGQAGVSSQVSGPDVSKEGAVGGTVDPGAAGELGRWVLVRYFAGARAAAGVSEERVELGARASVSDALAAVQARRGAALVRVLPSCSFLLNGIAVHDPATAVPDGGELDVLPPFAGG